MILGREAMARWALRHPSLPHFLFPLEPSGDAALLVAGGRAVVIVAGVAGAAQRVDAIVRAPGPCRLTSEYGRTLEIDPATLSWTGLVIADRPGTELLPASGQVPLLAMSRRDWELVLHELRSAAAVVRYLAWCAQPGPVVPPAHYTWLMVVSKRHPRLPVADRPLPEKPLLTDDLPGHAVIGRLLEYVAAAPLPETAGATVRHRLLSLIDEFPVGSRAELGRWTATVLRTGETARVRTFRFADGIPQYVVSVLPRSAEAFHDVVRLRHQQARERAAEPSAVVTFGFALSPEETGTLLIAQFTCLQGPADLTAEELASAQRFLAGQHPRMP